jgi:glycosyltransferase involved in cell wall biosynthesis
MRILQILHNHKFGGAEQHLVQLCTGLRAAGHDVEAAVPRGSWVWQRLKELGFTVHAFDFRAHYDVGSLLRLIVLLLRGKYDIVHTHLVRAAFYGRLATRFSKTPLVCTVHDLTTWKNYPRERPLIAVSEAVKRHLVFRGFSAEKIQVIFPGARDCTLGAESEVIRARVRSEFGLTPTDTAVFMIGRVAEVKGHDLAFEAACTLHARVGSSIRVFFAGQETTWGSELHASDIRGDVVWLGRRDDVPQLLAAADICIQPSRSEGLPLALMEASSAGKAMIATQVGGVPEVIEDHRNGLLIPPDDVDALVDAILLLVRNPALAEGFGVEARKRFDAQFAIETMIGATLSVYSECLQASPARA